MLNDQFEENQLFSVPNIMVARHALKIALNTTDPIKLETIQTVALRVESLFKQCMEKL